MENGRTFTLVKAEYGQVQSIFEIMCQIEAEIQDRNYFVADDREYIQNHIENDGFTLLAQQGHELAGFLIVDIPGEKEKNLGYDLHWSVEKLRTSAHMDSVVVLPRYRGFGLQKTLLRQGEQMLISRGFSSFLATVYPKNTPSLNSFLALGYQIGTTKYKYGGVLRHVLYKNMERQIMKGIQPETHS